MDVGSLELQLGGVTRSLDQWTRDFVSTYYPHLGDRPYRVPSLHFNQQTLLPGGDWEGHELHSPVESHSRGDLAQTLVMESLEQLSHLLHRHHHDPLFITSALDYDNYLAKVQLPPGQKKGKENARTPTKRKTASKAEAKSSNSPRKSDSGMEIEGESSREVYTEISGSSETGESSSFSSKNASEITNLDLAPCRENIEALKDSAFCRKDDVKTKGVSGLKQVEGDFSLFVKSQTSSVQEPGDVFASKIKERHSKDNSREIRSSNRTTSPTDMILSVESPPLKLSPRRSSTNVCGGSEKEAALPTEDHRGCSEGAASRAPAGMPPRPKDMSGRPQRGDIDVLLLSQRCGVVLVEVKSTGMPHPDFRYTDAEIQDCASKAFSQIQRARQVFRFIMPDLSTPPCVTLVVALPFVTRKMLQALTDLPEDPDLVFLCQDDTGADDANSPTVPSGLGSQDPPENQPKNHPSNSPVLRWWMDKVFPRGAPLPLDDFKTVVGRVCGLASVVSVWSRSKPRVEVRTASQAVSHTADRFADIVLLPPQAALLCRPSPPRLCLTGPQGSGKTLMLQLKGRQWVREGRRVVVLNVRAAGKGRPIGHVLEKAIQEGRRKAVEEGGANQVGSVERYDLATNQFCLEKFRNGLLEGGGIEGLCFILDELTQHSLFLLDGLMSAFPSCRIWCVAMFVKELPPGFRHFRLGAVLRSPPSVQLLLKELDLNPIHRGVYSTRSAARGLPCDGPPILFIHHQHHVDDTITTPAARPLDCKSCADEVVDILQHDLGLVFPVNQQSTPTHHQRGKRRKTVQSKFVEAQNLSFIDVLFLTCAPLGYYKPQENGLWDSSPSHLYAFCRYVQSCPFIARLKELGTPLRMIIDNTSPDIALPPQDEIVMTDVMGVQSLERKVVFFLPGGPMLEQSGHTNQATCNNQATQPTQPPNTGQHLYQCAGQSPGIGQNPEDLKRLSEKERLTASSLMLSSEVGRETNAGRLISQQTAEMKSLFGNMMVKLFPSSPTDVAQSDGKNPKATEGVGQGRESSDQQQNLISKEQHSGLDDQQSDLQQDSHLNAQQKSSANPQSDSHSYAQLHSQLVEQQDSSFIQQQSFKPRMGMSLRGDDPEYRQAWIDAKAILDDETQDTANSRNNKTQNSAKPCNDDAVEGSKNYCSPDSVFGVSDAGVKEGRRERELGRIRQALAELSMDDQDWLFVAAARCLSQLVVFIP